MNPRHIHVADVWSVHNAGDAAILEALLAGLNARWPNARLTVAARFPETCTALAGVEVLRDPLAFDEATLQAQALGAEAAGEDWKRLSQALDSADLVVSTGGYFLNGSEGNPFEWVLRSRLLRYERVLTRGTPLALLGQSFGPFQGAALRAAVQATLARIPLVTARDVEGFAALRTGAFAPAAHWTADLAVTLPAADAASVDAAMVRLGLVDGMFALGVRNYAGTPASAFKDVAALADDLILNHGLRVLLIGTTVPPADQSGIRDAERALGNDDVLALESVLAAMRRPDGAVLVREALPPRILKGVLGRCRAFISTRMHASILATCAGTPTVGIAYETKVRGWFDQLGMPEAVLPLAAVAPTALAKAAQWLLEDNALLRARLQRALPAVQERARENFTLLEALVARPRAAATPEPVVADERRSWEMESHHYDTLHVRLKRIVDLAERAPGSRLLDIGCSAGTLGAALSPRWTYHGCDISASAVASAPRGTCVACDLEAGMPAFDGQLYDVITLSGILEYITDVPKLLAAARARLAPGGRLIVSYFNMQHVARRTGMPFRHEHWKNDWSPAAFRELLAAAGFEIAESTFSTRGFDTAPDVRNEAAVLAQEARVDWSAFVPDDVNHTNIWCCTAEKAVTRAAEATVSAQPSVSVVIPAWNRLDLLKPVLEGFLAEQARHQAELIVVDDGSQPPVAGLIQELGAVQNIQLIRHAENSGRGAALNTGFAAAKGEVVIVTDSDIRPEPGFIADHIAAHARAKDPQSTFTGALRWGVDAGLLGRLLGARANPRLEGHPSELSWSIWYTDNWSFRRSAFAADAMRFDTGYRAWGFEDLELGWRLKQLGATNTLLGNATGSHLKAVTFEGLLGCFRRSVPNLMRLAAALSGESAVQDWKNCFMGSERAVEASERFLGAHWQRLEALAACHGSLESVLPPALWNTLAIALSDVMFKTGVARGGVEAAVHSFGGSDASRLLDLADLGSAIMLAESSLGVEEEGWNRMRAEVHALQRCCELPRSFELDFMKRMAWHAQHWVAACG